MKTKTPNEVVTFHFLRNALPIALCFGLTACSYGVDDMDPGNVSEAIVDNSVAVTQNLTLGAARPSRSAAQLANDFTQTLSYARQVADSDVVTIPSTTSPLAVVPEAPATASTETNTNATSNTELPLSSTNGTAPQVETSTELSGTGQAPATPSDTSESSEPSAELNSTIATNAATPLAPAPGSIVDDTPDNTVGTEFESQTTDGFVGQVQNDGTVKVNWATDPTARGYNVYRQAEYITTVFDTEYIDTDIFDSNYYYEIQAFDFADNFNRVATGLTVKVRGLGKPDPNAPVANAALLQDYALVFSDEFNGNSLDTSKWNTAYLWGADLVINNEEQYYVDVNNDPDFGFNPFSFDGENLSITSIRTPEALKPQALNQPYLSGVITSYDAFKFTYGYVETRAKVPYGKGFWPAFWLLNAYYVDDKPEIDIMEFIGDDQDVVYHTYHYYDSNDELRSTKSAPTPGIDYTSDFHTYAVEWKPGTLVFYVDGVEQHRVVDPKVSQQEMYVIANTAICGWWPGSPDETTPFPAEFQIDYIRVYQKTTPFSDIIFDDLTTNVPPATSVPGTAPNHRPPYEMWPEGYPDR